MPEIARAMPKPSLLDEIAFELFMTSGARAGAAAAAARADQASAAGHTQAAWQWRRIAAQVKRTRPGRRRWR
jgi:hypothetical protein